MSQHVSGSKVTAESTNVTAFELCVVEKHPNLRLRDLQVVLSMWGR